MWLVFDKKGVLILETEDLLTALLESKSAGGVHIAVRDHGPMQFGFNFNTKGDLQ